jgi:hypothetical protein
MTLWLDGQNELVPGLSGQLQKWGLGVEVVLKLVSGVSGEVYMDAPLSVVSEFSVPLENPSGAILSSAASLEYPSQSKLPLAHRKHIGLFSMVSFVSRAVPSRALAYPVFSYHRI